MSALEEYLKEAETSGTSLMPYQGPSDKSCGKSDKTVIKKAESHGPDDNMDSPVKGEQAPKLPQSGELKPHVDVSGKEPPKLLATKEAEFYALPSQKMYPLDGYDQVVKAAEYFGEWGPRFAPEHRREYCSNLVKRASVLKVRVSPEIRKYGSATYAPTSELQVALAGRRGVITKEAHVELLNELEEAQPTLDPETFAGTLAEFDKVAGIDHLYDQDILDPYYSTYGVKHAEGPAALEQNTYDQDQSFVMGNEVVTGKQLKAFAASHSKDITDTFGEDFLKEFRKDPVGIFSSLPMDQKKIISRQANDNSPS